MPKKTVPDHTLLIRDRLLQSLQARLHSSNLANITIAQIAHGADTSVGSFYAYFKSKEDALSELMRRWINDFAEALDAVSHEDPQQFIADTLLIYLKTMVDDQLASQVYLRMVNRGTPIASQAGSPHFREVWRLAHAKWLDRLGQVLALDSDPEKHRQLHLLSAATDGIILRIALHQDEHVSKQFPNREALHRSLLALFKRVLLD